MTSISRTSDQIHPLKFPCLMKSLRGKKEIVLFTSDKYGMVVNCPETPELIGYYDSNWTSANNRDVWTPFHGEVILYS